MTMVITLGDIILLVFIIVVGWMAVLVALATIIQNQKPKRRKKKMNKVILMGRLVRDADIRYSQGANGNICIAKFTLAVDRRVKKENEQNADFISCVAFGKTGEFVEKYVSKGTKVIVEGHWQTGSYKNKEGQAIYTNDCVVDSIEFAESKKTETKEEIPNELLNPTIDESELPFV